MNSDSLLALAKMMNNLAKAGKLASFVPSAKADGN